VQNTGIPGLLIPGLLAAGDVVSDLHRTGMTAQQRFKKHVPAKAGMAIPFLGGKPLRNRSGHSLSA
jgi:hypothetical protein